MDSLEYLLKHVSEGGRSLTRQSCRWEENIDTSCITQAQDRKVVGPHPCSTGPFVVINFLTS